MTNKKNVELPEGHKQVVVWPGTVIEEDQIEKFEEWVLAEFNTRIKYLETIITKPDRHGPGGRADVFFSVHTDDISQFCKPKIEMQARWIEDVLSVANDNAHLYPPRIKEYECWNADNDTDEEKANNTYKICDNCANGEANE